MTRKTVKLSNCYIPLRQSVEETKQASKKRSSGDGRNTERESHSLRRLVIESNVLSLAPGSALVELGHTKVLCQVHGPVTATSDLIPSSVQLSMETGTLYLPVKYLPHVGYPTSDLVASMVTSVDQPHVSAGKINSWAVSRETDLSSRLFSALSAAVPLKQYPKCAIIVQTTVLQDDGSALPACIAAATLALTNASVEIFDLVSSCSVAVAEDGTLLADPDLQEERDANALVTLAVLPNWKEVSLWEQSGQLSPEQANRAIDLCRDGCRTMHRFLRDHLLEQNDSNNNT